MKMTLLDIVQDIQSDLDFDEVNSIDDTIESEQVARIVKSTYYSLMSNRLWPHLRRTIALDPVSNLAMPTHMRLADPIKKLCFINYDCAKLGETKKNYTKIKFLEPDQFIFKSNTRDSSAPNILTVDDFGGVELFIQLDKAPEFFTTFDDEHIVFDSLDQSVDSTLQDSKVQAQAYVVPVWKHEDSFVPDLPDDAFTALVEEAKSRASVRLKQTTDPVAQEESRRQQTWLSRKARRVNGGIKFPNYGRK
jgi:hypothetical protein